MSKTFNREEADKELANMALKLTEKQQERTLAGQKAVADLEAAHAARGRTKKAQETADSLTSTAKNLKLLLKGELASSRSRAQGELEESTATQKEADKRAEKSKEEAGRIDGEISLLIRCKKEILANSRREAFELVKAQGGAQAKDLEDIRMREDEAKAEIENLTKIKKEVEDLVATLEKAKRKASEAENPRPYSSGSNYGGINIGGMNMGGISIGGMNVGGISIGGIDLGDGDQGGISYGVSAGGFNIGGMNLGGIDLTGVGVGGMGSLTDSPNVALNREAVSIPAESENARRALLALNEELKNLPRKPSEYKLRSALRAAEEASRALSYAAGAIERELAELETSRNTILDGAGREKPQPKERKLGM